jgi:hypothetical protein
MSIINDAYESRGGWRPIARRIRRQLFYAVKKASFALLRKLDPDFKLEVAESPVTTEQQTRQPGDGVADVVSAIVINSDQAIASSEILRFYLSGVFQDKEALNWSLDLFRGVDGLTLEEIAARLEREIEKSLRGSPSLDAVNRYRAFICHREASQQNRRAYSTAGRVNPNAVFWPDPTDPRNSRSLYSELPFAKRVPLIDKSTAIVSAGSCFATEIAHALQSNGYNYLVKETNRGKPGSYEFLDTGDMPNSSAAWGVIFNTPSFRQLVEKAFELRKLPKILWTMQHGGKLRYLDPFRENIAFESPQAYEENYQDHIDAARQAFLEMDVFIITLGLNEVWYFKADGSVFSRSPWRTAPLLVGRKVLTVQENVNDLVRMTEILRAHNANVKIICTLSPIALHATFRADEQHIVTANAHSKAVLRVAAEEFARCCSDVHYFPSFEVVTTSTKIPWAADQRHVAPEAIRNVMTLFHQTYAKGPTIAESPLAEIQKGASP